MIKKYFFKLKSIAIVMLFSCLYSNLFAQSDVDSLQAAQWLESANDLAKEQNYEASNKLALQAAETFGQLNFWQAWLDSYYRVFLNGLYAKEYDVAIPILEKSLSEIPDNEPLILAKMHTFLGYSYNATGEIFTSLDAYETSIPFFLAAKDTARLNSTYGNIGLGYIQLGAYAKAIGFLKNALVLGKNSPELTTLWKNHKMLGEAYYYKGDWKKAEKTYQAARALHDPKDGTFERYDAQVFLAQKQYKKALRAAEQGIILSEKSYGKLEGNINAFKQLIGSIYIEYNRPQKALSYFNDILPYYKKGPNKRDLGKLYILIADAQRRLKQYEKALKNYQNALQVFLPHFKKNDHRDNPSKEDWKQEVWLMEIFRGKGKCFYQKYIQSNKEDWLYLAAHNFQLAIDFIHNVKLNYETSESKFLLGDYTHPFYEELIRVKLASYDLNSNKKQLEEAFQIAQKANAFVLRELLNEQKALAVSGVPKDSLDLLEHFREKSILLNRMIERNKDVNVDSLQALQFTVQRKVAKLKASIAANHPKYAQLRNDLEVADIASLQNKIAPSTLLVKYFLGTETLYIFSLSHANFKVDTIALPPNFRTLIDQYRRSISDLDFVKKEAKTAEQQYLKSARKLYQLLLEKPLERHSKKQTINRLTIVADDVLNTIPFQALLWQDSNSWTDPDHFLISKYAINYAYFCKLLLAPPKPILEKNGLVSFGLEFDDYTLQYLQKIAKDSIKNQVIKENLRSGTLSNLPFSDDEAMEVAELMQGTSWLNERATKDNFLKNTPRAKLIHIVTHSLLDWDNPNASSLIFIKTKDSLDNLLRLEEIYNLRFQAEMIVLSACNTGFGQSHKGEGINSLARAFNFSGIPSVTATLWNISDEASKKMMALNYAYLKKGEAKDMALQKAQLEYLSNDAISSPAFRAPVYWAAWISIGDHRAIVLEEGLSFWWYFMGVGLVLVLGLWWLKKEK